LLDSAKQFFKIISQEIQQIIYKSSQISIFIIKRDNLLLLLFYILFTFVPRFIMDFVDRRINMNN